MARTVLVDILTVFFGIGTWVCVNGLWVELPLLVAALPEGWTLPSYLSVVIQLANIGPLSYSILHSMFPKVVREKWVIYLTMTIGSVSTILLALFWDRTTYIFGDTRSTALLSLVFCLALVDCSSRVLFLPFMAGFKENYLTSFFIGEGLSGFVPSIFALIQGVGGNPSCRNETVNDTDGQLVEKSVAVYADPLFSIEIFFYLLFGIMIASMSAFILLNTRSIVKDALVHSQNPSPRVVLLGPDQQPITSYQSTSPGMPLAGRSGSGGGDDNDSASDDGSVASVRIMGVTPISKSSLHHHLTDQDNNVEKSSIKKFEYFKEVSKPVFLYLLAVQLIVCALSNGIFPSIQSYSSLPYGNVAYHWTVTLSSIANPAVCFLALYIPPPTKETVSKVTALGFLVASYVLTTAVLSPTPPLTSSAIGEILVVLSWILLVGFFTYVKVSVAMILRGEGKRGLFWCGAVTQLGSAVGAIVIFFLVNNTQIFESFSPCS